MGAKIAETETKFRRLEIQQPFHVALFAGEEPGQPMQQTNRSLAVEIGVIKPSSARTCSRGIG